jgi:hypothetical protein
VAQAFAFATAALELLIDVEGTALATDRPANEQPFAAATALKLIAFAELLPVRSVYLTSQGDGPELLVTEDQPADLSWVTEILSPAPAEVERPEGESSDGIDLP